MKKEIYITLLLFAFMLFALISTVVRGQSFTAKGSDKFSPSIDNNTSIIQQSSSKKLRALTADWCSRIEKGGLQRMALIVQFDGH